MTLFRTSCVSLNRNPFIGVMPIMHSVAANKKIKDLSTAAKSIKHKRIENAVEEILDALGLDLSNDSLRETPTRVAKT